MPDVPYLRLVRPPLETSKVTIVMPVEMRRALEREAHAAGYQALSGYIRDVRLRGRTPPRSPQGRTG